jgi:hypothetical protein
MANYGVYSEWQWRKQFFRFRQQYDGMTDTLTVMLD